MWCESGQLRVVEQQQLIREEDAFSFRETKLQLQLFPGTIIGAFQSNLVLEMRQQGRSELIQLPVFWKIPGVYEVYPKRVFFGVVEKGAEQAVMRVQVRRLDKQPIGEIRQVAVSEASLTTEVVQGESSNAKIIEFRLDPGKMKGTGFWEEALIEAAQYWVVSPHCCQVA